MEKPAKKFTKSKKDTIVGDDTPEPPGDNDNEKDDNDDSGQTTGEKTPDMTQMTIRHITQFLEVGHVERKHRKAKIIVAAMFT